MAQSRRKWPRELKLRILAEVQAGERVVTVARQYDLAPVQIYQWQRQYAKYGDDGFRGNGHAYTHEAKFAALERKVGQLTMENDLLKKAQMLLLKQHQQSLGRGGKS